MAEISLSALMLHFMFYKHTKLEFLDFLRHQRTVQKPSAQRLTLEENSTAIQCLKVHINHEIVANSKKYGIKHVFFKLIRHDRFTIAERI